MLPKDPLNAQQPKPMLPGRLLCSTDRSVLDENRRGGVLYRKIQPLFRNDAAADDPLPIDPLAGFDGIVQKIRKQYDHGICLQLQV